MKNKYTKDSCIQTKSNIYATYDNLHEKHDILDKELSEAQENLHIKTKEFNKKNGENKSLSEQLKASRDHEEVLRNPVEEREKTITAKQMELAEIYMDNVKQNPDFITASVPLSTNLEKLFNDRFDKIEQSIDQLVTKKVEE